jgi:hypothetical protein
MGKAAHMLIGLIAMVWMLSMLLAIAMCRASARSETQAALTPRDRLRYYTELSRSERPRSARAELSRSAH